MPAAPHAVPLPVAAQQGQGAAQPPGRIQQKGGQHGGVEGEPHRLVPQHDGQADHEGDAAAGVAESVPHRRDLVHPLGGGDVGEHRVIKDQTGAVADLGDDETAQKPHPGLEQAHHRAAGDAHRHAQHKELLFHAGQVGHRAQGGPQHGHHHRHKGRRIPPEGQVFGVAQARRPGQPVEIDGQDGGDQQSERRVAHVVQDPALFQAGHFL